jgi:hypothetical protein
MQTEVGRLKKGGEGLGGFNKCILRGINRIDSSSKVMYASYITQKGDSQ